MDFANLDTARSEAIESVRDLVAEHIKSRLPTTDFRIDVYDDTGSLVFIARMADALKQLVVIRP